MIDLKKILVKEYSFEDFFNLKGLAKLIQEYVNSSNNPLVQDVDITYIDEVKDAYKSLLKNNNVTFHAITDDDVVVGLASLIQSSNGNSPESVIDINAIYVTPEYRRHGFGTKLLKYIDEFALSHGAVGIYFQVPVGSRLENVLDKGSYFQKTYSLFFRSLKNG